MTHSDNKTRLLSLRIRPWGLAVASGAILTAATLAGFLGGLCWFLDLFSHFRVQYFVGLSAVALVLLLRRRYRAPLFFGVCALVNLCAILPLYFGKEPQPAQTSRLYRALLLNVNTHSGVPARVASVIQQSDPDILVLEEINQRWLSALAVPLRSYPYSAVLPRQDNFGIGLFSKHRFLHGGIRDLGQADVPSALAEVQLPEGRLTVLATHPLPPSGVAYSQLRDGQLAQIPEIVKQANSPVLVLGDLNATPWGSSFQRLLRQSGLRDSSQGRGILTTWPAQNFLFRLPIDHCLHTAGVYVTHRRTGPKVGSDHYPLIVDFVLASRPPSAPQP